MPIDFLDDVEYFLEQKDVSLDRFNDLPENCPFCHHSVSPTYILQYLMNGNNRYLLCGCPRDSCGMLYIAHYTTDPNNNYKYSLNNVYPHEHESYEFSDEIHNLSPNFVKIYNQAFMAEQSGLNEICGSGYRKALEFLIKDYAIKLSPADEGDIKKKFLKPCIVTYIQHPQVEFLAERAAWLGNDEAHYERKWVEKDVQDLKMLIKLTVSYIEMELIAEKIRVEMAEGR